MAEISTENIQIKIFIGTLLSHEIKRFLNQSSTWKEAKIVGQNLQSEWRELHFQNKDYFGKYIPESHISLPDLRTIENELKELIMKHYEDLPVDKIKVVIFPQMFVT
jgi:hypothetical protein